MKHRKRQAHVQRKSPCRGCARCQSSPPAHAEDRSDHAHKTSVPQNTSACTCTELNKLVNLRCEGSPPGDGGRWDAESDLCLEVFHAWGLGKIGPTQDETTQLKIDSCTQCHTYTHAHMRTGARAHTHIHTHALAHIHIDKRPHTHIHSLSFPPRSHTSLNTTY